jgi:hypothetical protein
MIFSENRIKKIKVTQSAKIREAKIEGRTEKIEN